jgi:hypothetical protein
MKKPLAVIASIVAALTIVFVGVVAPAAAGGTSISKYGDTFTYNGSNSWTIQNTDDDQQIKDIGNTTNAELCSNYDTGIGKPCVNNASYTFAGDTSQTGYNCAYVQIDGGNAGSQDTVPGDSSKSVCVPNTTVADASAAVTTTPASCTSAESVATGTISGATWGTITYSGAGNLNYSVVATATSGHAFAAATGVSADGSTDTFTGTLNPELTTGCTTAKVCIPSSAVTYTYSHDRNNDGVIVVNDVANSTGELCNPFYVTATSWKFTNNSSIWPQKVDVVDQLGEISTPGSYTYAALVSCGQGDIYASTNPKAADLDPANYPTDTGYLKGSNSPFTETFLSGMGFTQVDSTGKPDNGSSTYYVDSDSCFIPTSETGTPIPSWASCAAPNANELSLPAVIGGVWTVSNTGYSKTYPIDTAEDITTVPNGYSTYSVVLSDGDGTDGYRVDMKTSTWTPVDMTGVDCNTQVTPISPDAEDAVSCIDGSITIPSVTGVTYYLDGTKVGSGSTIQNLTGSHTVIAKADSGYEFVAGSYPPVTADNPTGGWTYDLGSTSTCVIESVLDGCTFNTDTGASSQDVTLTFDNSGKSTPTNFEVNGTTYPVDAHSTLAQDVGPIDSAGGTIDVYVNGAATPIVVTVPSFDTCIPVTPGDPKVIEQTCDAVLNTPVNDGEIDITLNPLLTYTLTGPLGPDSTTSIVTTSAITGLAAGDYVLSVVPATGYVIAGPTSWPLTLTIHPTACTVAPTSVVASCTSNPESPTEILGQIGVTLNPNIDYSVTGGSIVGSQELTAASTSFPDGMYTVSAALTDAATKAGYRLVGATSWPAVSFAEICLPVLSAWHADATGAPATCSATGSTVGYIHLLHKASEKGDVKYSIENDATHRVVNVGHTVVNVKEAPGSYTVTASPVVAKDGISGTTVFDVTVAAATGECGSLAFTGGGFAGYLGVSLAFGMLFLGAAALWMRRRFGARTAR